MRRNLAIVVLFILFAPGYLHAQELSNAEKRRINLKVLNTLEQYERTAALSDEEEIYMFKELFHSLDSTYVVQDLMGVKDYLSEVSVQEYLNLATATTTGIDLTLYDVRKGNMTFNDGVWEIPVTCKKKVIYIDRNSVLFSSDEFYEGQKYDFVLNLTYDPYSDVCRIASIKGKIESDNEFPKGRFYILNKDDQRSPRELKKERKLFEYNNLSYNSFDQVFVEQSKLKPWHGDIRVKPKSTAETENYDVVTLKYNKLKWRGKIRYAHTYAKEDSPLFPGAFNVLTNDDKINARTFAREYGVEIGRSALVGKHGSLSIYTGFAMSTSIVDFSMSDVRYGYNTVDAQGRTYQRYYDIDNVSENIVYNDYVIPVYFSLDHRFFKWMQWNWTFGGKIYINRDVKAGPLVYEGKVTDGMNGSHLADLGEYDKFLSPSSYNNYMSYSAIAGLSMNVNLYKHYAYLYVKATYEFGIGTRGIGYYHGDSDKEMSRFYGNTNYPLVYSAQLDSDIAVRSFLDCVRLHRQSLWFETGLLFKF